MKRVRILRGGAIGDPGNVRAAVIHTEKDQIIELSDTAANMCVNVSDPPRAEYIDDEPVSDDDPASGDEPGSDDGEGKRSLLDRIRGKGDGEGEGDSEGEGSGDPSLLE